MCWISLTLPIAKEADEDIPVFKICDFDAGRIRSMVFSFPYVLNMVYVMPPPEFQLELSGWTINRGFHSYANDCIVEEISENILEIKSPSYTHGSRVLLRFNKRHSTIVTGYIPKGATYFENNLGEIVSSHIVLTEIKN